MVVVSQLLQEIQSEARSLIIIHTFTGHSRPGQDQNDLCTF